MSGTCPSQTSSSPCDDNAPAPLFLIPEDQEPTLSPFYLDSFQTVDLHSPSTPPSTQEQSVSSGPSLTSGSASKESVSLDGVSPAAIRSKCSMSQEQTFEEIKQQFIDAARNKNPDYDPSKATIPAGPARIFVAEFVKDKKSYIFQETPIAGMKAGKGLRYYSPLVGWPSFDRRCVNVPKSCDNIPEFILKACGGKPIGFAADRMTLNNKVHATRLIVCVPNDNELSEWNVVCVIDPDDRNNIFDVKELATYLESIMENEKQKSQASAVLRERDSQDNVIEGKRKRKRGRIENGETTAEQLLDPCLQNQVQNIIENYPSVPQQFEIPVTLNNSQKQGEGADQNQQTQTFSAFGPFPYITAEDAVDNNGDTVSKNKETDNTNESNIDCDKKQDDEPNKNIESNPAEFNNNDSNSSVQFVEMPDDIGLLFYNDIPVTQMYGSNDYYF